MRSTDQDGGCSSFRPRPSPQLQRCAGGQGHQDAERVAPAVRIHRTVPATAGSACLGGSLGSFPFCAQDVSPLLFGPPSAVLGGPSVRLLVGAYTDLTAGLGALLTSGLPVPVGHCGPLGSDLFGAGADLALLSRRIDGGMTATGAA